MPLKNGEREGIVKEYDEYGNLMFESPYNNGKLEGMTTFYYSSGDIFAEIPYTNDKVNGIIKAYNEGKKLIWQANAQNGKLVSGKCSSGKALTNAHLTRLTNDISELKRGGDYWYDICKK